MTDTMVAGTLHRESDFRVIRGARRFGTCGPNAAHTLLTNVLGRYVSTAEVYGALADAGLLSDASGATWPDALRIICQDFKADVAEFRDYGDTWDEWPAFFARHVGRDPFLMETNYGQALVDEISGAGENAADLRRHFIAVLGRHDGGYSDRAGRDLPAGYWCADGANYAGGNDNANGFNAANVLQFYSDDVMRASLPCAALALKGVGTMGVPQGWSDDGHTLTAPNGGHVSGGFRDYVMGSHWNPANTPVSGEVRLDWNLEGNHDFGGTQAGSAFTVAQFFADGMLVVSNGAAGGMWYIGSGLGGEVWLFRQQVDALTAQVADLTAKLAQAQSGQPVPPAPQGNPLNDAAIEALAVALAAHSK